MGFTKEQKEAGKAIFIRFTTYLGNLTGENNFREKIPESRWEKLPQKIKDAWYYSAGKDKEE